MICCITGGKFHSLTYRRKSKEIQRKGWCAIVFKKRNGCLEPIILRIAGLASQDTSPKTAGSVGSALCWHLLSECYHGSISPFWVTSNTLKNGWSVFEAQDGLFTPRIHRPLISACSDCWTFVGEHLTGHWVLTSNERALHSNLPCVTEALQ